jgi:hypothetical protein
MKQIMVEVKGKKYRLQHPGARAWMKQQESVIKTDGSFGFEAIVDYGLQNVIKPVEGPLLNWEYFDERMEELNIWQMILAFFLPNGYLEEDKSKPPSYKILEGAKKKDDGADQGGSPAKL